MHISTHSNISVALVKFLLHPILSNVLPVKVEEAIMWAEHPVRRMLQDAMPSQYIALAGKGGT